MRSVGGSKLLFYLSILARCDDSDKFDRRSLVVCLKETRGEGEKKRMLDVWSGKYMVEIKSYLVRIKI